MNLLRERAIAVAALLAMLWVPAAYSQVFFQDGFESGNLSTSQNGFRWTNQTRTAVSSVAAKTGSYSLQFTFAGSPPGTDAFSEQRFSLGKNYSDVWVKYDILIPANYRHRTETVGASNNKGYLYLWSGDYGSPSGPGMGPNFWPNPDGTSFMSFYYWGPGLDRHIPDIPRAVEAADYGKWIEIIAHYKYASSANNDGVAEMWKTRDGVRQKILDVRNGPWYVAGQPGFDQGYLLGWANSGFDQTTVFYIDNVVFSTTSLLGAAPPQAPTGLTAR